MTCKANRVKSLTYHTIYTRDHTINLDASHKLENIQTLKEEGKCKLNIKKTFILKA